MSTWLLAMVVPSVCSLVALWLVLRFLWQVYRVGGRTDMTAAADAVRRARPTLARMASERLLRRPAVEERVDANDEGASSGVG
ncbi:hypothetical protein [Nocardia sp. NPDC057227]|uniref:hypothetical protein n=1 Tax=Nocardia sp. NPDC057227 TaxID=3346056 RepID=UPI0036362929